VRDCIRQSSIAGNLRPPPTSRAAGTALLRRASSSAGLNVRQRVQLRKQSAKYRPWMGRERWAGAPTCWPVRPRPSASSSLLAACPRQDAATQECVGGSTWRRRHWRRRLPPSPRRWIRAP
jgi:hypothetical protein